MQAFRQSTAPPNASASLAATRAFSRDPNATAELSSAAAAAALRTLSPPPVSVGDTVTKRMARKNSLSSQGSAGDRPQALRRHSSSGSMTERSFRDKSPNRSSPVAYDAPPVPQVPKNLPATSTVNRRASSLEPSYRGGSPAGRGGGRGLSLDRAGQQAPARGQQRNTPSLSKVSEVEADGNGGPRSSVNFSRPMSPQQTPSPTVGRGSERGGQSGWFGGPVVNKEQTFRGETPRPKSSQGSMSFAAHNTQQAVQNAADRPVSTRRSQLAHGVQGARLSSGSMRAKPSGTAVQSRPSTSAGVPRVVDPKSPFAVYDPSTRTFIHKGDAIALHQSMSEEELNPQPSHETQRVATPRQHNTPQPRRVEQPAPKTQHVDEWVSTPQKQDYRPQQQYEDEVSTTSSQPYLEHANTNVAKDVHRQDNQHSENVAEAALPQGKEANTSRKLEVIVPHSAKSPPELMPSPQFASNLDSSYPRLETTSKSEATLQARPSTRSERNYSLSPPRNAHFAPMATELSGTKHQPLPRSVSPAKSALKPSPSTSRRSYSPVAIDVLTRHAAPPSETSDAMSDGDVSRRKKKNVRVSFDEAPVIAGTSSYADMDSPYEPTGLQSSRWSTAMDDEDDELDDYSKPRPVLPSFGSIRGQDRRSREEEGPEKVTETVSSSLSASAISATSGPLESSNDHVVGGILAQDFAAKAAHSNDPLPPEVTTVEGTGYGSDSEKTDSSVDEPSSNAVPKPSTAIKETPSISEPEPKMLTNPVESNTPSAGIPNIAVQPASPLPSEQTEYIAEKVEPQVKRQRSFVPGGWDDDEETDEEQQEEPKSVQPTPSVQSTPASTGPSIRFQEPPSPSRDADSESTDNDSIYSDAYEDLSDPDEGFGSIDALLESPVSSRSGLMGSQYSTTSPHTPSGLRNESKDDREEERNTSADWEATREHWSQVNEARKAKPVERTNSTSKKQTAAPPSQERRTRVANAEATAKPQQQQQQQKQQEPSKPPRSTAQPRKSAMKKPVDSPQARSTPETQMRKSMRNGPTAAPVSTPEPRMRKSMRDGPVPVNQPSTDTHMRKSMRGSDPVASNRATPGLAASRYSAPPIDTKPPKGTLQKKHIPAAAAAASSMPRQRPQSASAAAPKAVAPAQTYNKSRTYDSDSDASASSFQRQRPRRGRENSGRYTMRSSMRSGPAPATRPAPTMRSISPPVASSPPPTMRKSMRPTSPTVDSPTNAKVKSSRFSIRSLSPAGRFRTKSSTEKPAPPPAQAPPPPKMKPVSKAKNKTPAAPPHKSRFKSRFADSSDEEDATPRRFQSRFADSDDSDEFELPPDLAPVRGIPRKAGDEDEDSTDLEDEVSDAEAPAPAQISKNTPTAPNGAPAHSASASSPPVMPVMQAGKKAKSKRGFFGLGKKKAPSPSYIDSDTDARNSASIDIPMPPEHRNRDPTRPLSAIGEDDAAADQGAQQQSPRSRSPKLQRRSTPQWGRSTSDSWPLPSPPAIGKDARPQSSDGLVGRRPTLVKRVSSQMTQAAKSNSASNGGGSVVGNSSSGRRESEAGSSNHGGGGKKKKFQGLRRVFGLND